jgi:hypothetical protein
VSPDAAELRAFLDRVTGRLRWLAVAEGAAAGLWVAFVVTVLVAVLGSSRITPGEVALGGLILGAAGSVMRLLMTRPTAASVAAFVERRAPECRNVVITGAELIGVPADRTAAAGDYVASIVWRDAARVVRSLSAQRLVSARRPLVLLLAAAILWTAALVRAASPALAAFIPASRGSAPAGATIGGIDVEITPPAYTGLPSKTVHDPDRIEALAGSGLHLTIRGRAARVTVETLTGARTAEQQPKGTFSASVAADADGYLAVQAISPAGATGARRLIGLSITPDFAPRVRITVPAKDLTLTDAHAALDISAEASDDIGLATLRLRYTKVSGSDERFTFAEGEVPLDVIRRDARTWTARVHWPLDALALTPGDMVVYRAVATDNRPGTTPSESDSYIAELPAPGGNAATGFSLDPTEQRYAVSQQMVILKTERLLANKSKMTADAFSSESQDIAAEQRKVRAEFVFMMGGEVADAPDPNADPSNLNEVAEAEGESDLAAGRMFNQGRVALQTAIRAMSRAATSLAIGAPEPALPSEREALANLEQAFSRSRIILRALTQQERLDLTRRLSGTLTDAARTERPSPNPAADPTVTALRRSLAEIASLSGARRTDATTSATASSLAEAVLRVNPSDPALQSVAAVLDSAARAGGSGGRALAREQLDRAATALASAVRKSLLSAPIGRVGNTVDRLNGALVDALRPAGGTP